MHRSNILVPVSAALAPFDVGPTSPGASSGNLSGITGSKITLPKTGTLQSISAYLQTGGATNVLLGLYADSSGNPGSLLASSAMTSVNSPSPAWTTLTIASGPSVGAVACWVVIQNQSNLTGWFTTPLGAGVFNNSVSWTGSLPTSFPLSGSGAYTFTLYATFLG